MRGGCAGGATLSGGVLSGLEIAPLREIFAHVVGKSTLLAMTRRIMRQSPWACSSHCLHNPACRYPRSVRDTCVRRYPRVPPSNMSSVKPGAIVQPKSEYLSAFQHVPRLPHACGYHKLHVLTFERVAAHDHVSAEAVRIQQAPAAADLRHRNARLRRRAACGKAIGCAVHRSTWR